MTSGDAKNTIVLAIDHLETASELLDAMLHPSEQKQRECDRVADDLTVLANRLRSINRDG